jgi:hypothetical protein
MRRDSSAAVATVAPEQNERPKPAAAVLATMRHCEGLLRRCVERRLALGDVM